jgi:DNA repair protein RecO (recombination protein O)
VSLYRTKGIVLNRKDFGDTGRIVCIYTTHNGKISAIAKGAKRLTSKFGSTLEIFSYIDLVLYKGRELHTISETRIIDSFQALRENLSKIAYGSFVLELIDAFMVEEERNIQAFNLILDTLRWLKEETTEFIIYFFTLNFLSLLGFRPEVERCLKCKRKIEGSAFFSSRNGGLTCINCGGGAWSIKVSQMAICLMRWILSRKGRPQRTYIPRSLLNELHRVVLNDYLAFHSPYPLKSLNLIFKNLDGGER